MREPNLMGRVTDKECSDWQLTEDSCRSPLYERMAAMVGIRLTSLRVHRRKAVVEISLPVSSRSSSSADDPDQPDDVCKADVGSLIFNLPVAVSE